MAELDESTQSSIAVPGREAMVRFERVSKSFGPVECLRDLDLDVAAGEKLAIIGPSGSGKTTILRLLMTLERPDSGIIEIEGETLWGERHGSGDSRNIKLVRRKIG